MNADRTPLRVLLLGPLQLEGVELEGAKQRALFTLLALRAGSPVPADELAEAIWPGELPREARLALQQQVSRLRRRLGDLAGIRHRHAAYVLDLAPAAVDVHRFEELVRVARRALDHGEVEQAAAGLHAALGLWRGGALADSRYDAFAQPAIARLEELRLQAVEDLLATRLAAGEGGELVGELQELVTAHPLRERLRSQHMLALYRSGRQAEALAVMREGTRMLIDELGLEPGPELRAMERMILNQAAELQPAAAAVVPVAVPAPQNATVGREQDLARVCRLLREPAVRLVTLTGPGGVGKSRLASCAAPAVADAFPGGVVYVDLEGAEPGAGPLADAALRVRGTAAATLLILDGFERFDDRAPDVGAMLAGDASLTILATSRSGLRLTSEHTVIVAPLALSDAAELFAQRAAAACPGWDAGVEDPATIARVCARLDGLPFAIELAAAQVSVLSVRDLLERLEDPLGTLVDGPCDLPARQRSLRATLAHSWALLDERERLLLGRMSVLDGDVTLSAAEAACNADGAVGSVAPVVTSLLSKAGLVRFDRGAGPSFGMLSTHRAYARERFARDAVAA
jgi:predicted ATPase/DNA-binding SARP family transcriptional activator